MNVVGEPPAGATPPDAIKPPNSEDAHVGDPKLAQLMATLGGTAVRRGYNYSEEYATSIAAALDTVVVSMHNGTLSVAPESVTSFITELTRMEEEGIQQRLTKHGIESQQTRVAALKAGDIKAGIECAEEQLDKTLGQIPYFEKKIGTDPSAKTLVAQKQATSARLIQGLTTLRSQAQIP